ncbi:ABC transporter ATP-binding protein [Chitinophaga nivalis]|uniref:ABC transporter transmembrane domain-containing protein n=1 Tax=Chitinophaga nivalis TaxID=2991709 RepID=A0ABT3IGY0_9BACT|nr:ABC transporter transmembrane domain-containing protein [Chitinophaga nivalis]MCW3467111.1 ABC transporter transmembrane domain-containing protein [Chitinophaga nivalis]MCW3483198.1 ABC transporter transmembrane domain-containing protein [Chitinophaga nivalis]
MQSNEVKKNQSAGAGTFKQTLRLYKYVKPFWIEFTIGMVLLLASSISSLFIPDLLGKLVDSGQKMRLTPEINRLGFILVAVLIGQGICSFFRVIFFVNVTEKTLSSLRQHIYNHLIQLPMKFFLTRRVGELNSRISADISLLQETFTTTIAEFIRNLIVLAGGFVLLLTTSAKLTFFMLMLLPVILVVAFVFGKYIRKFSKAAQDRVAEANTILEETLQGILNVKAFANEFFEMRRYGKKINEAAEIGMKSGIYRGAFLSFLMLCIFGAMVAVIWKGSLLIASGEMQSAGELVSFVIYSAFIGGAVTELAEVYSNLQKSIGATENLLEILEEPAEELTAPAAIAPEHELNGLITFENISFHYPSRSDVSVLKDISFSVEANQKVALVGPSGAGKSTIVSLLLRFYDPVNGAISFDGRDGRDFPYSVLRNQMAVVLQDVFLFGSSIRDNIAYGKPGATEEEIIYAAKQANAWEFIQNFPEGMDTMVGDRGVQLSGGQRQRIAIARAVLKNPRILILDEATSALDAESEKLVQDALDKLMEGRTSIIIAHRLATVREADKIVVLDDGYVVEEGTHHELLTVDGGIYRNLSTMQFTN